jgi:hypothetical protein
MTRLNPRSVSWLQEMMAQMLGSSQTTMTPSTSTWALTLSARLPQLRHHVRLRRPPAIR